MSQPITFKRDAVTKVYYTNTRFYIARACDCNRSGCAYAWGVYDYEAAELLDYDSTLAAAKATLTRIATTN